jgi:alanine racemase
MNCYSINKIANIVQGKLLSENNENVFISHLVFDTRKIIFSESSLFFALKSNKNNGHKYISDAYNAGVLNFVVSEQSNYSHLKNANIILVVDTRLALQQLSIFHRNLFTIPIVGVTGSNGKTIVKEWLYQLLNNQLSICKNPKSYNSQVGVPLSVWQLNEHHQLGLFEAGISEKLEMQNLANIINPSIGIFNYLGNAHSEGFENDIEKLNEKCKLFINVKYLLYSVDQTLVNKMLVDYKKQHQIKTYTWSKINQPADYNFDLLFSDKQTTISCNVLGKSVIIPFTDEASIWNACSCFAFILMVNETKLFALNIDEVLTNFETLQAVEMRLQLKEANNNCIVINDSYNNDVDSLKIALNFLFHQGKGMYKTLILSDIFQSGLSQFELCNQVNGLLKANEVSKLIGIGNMFDAFKNLLPNNSLFFQNTAQFIENFSSLNFENEIILLKGSRQFEFEKINALFEKWVHETVFEINLNSLTNNFNVYRKIVKPEVKIMAMVKAFSYGTGSYEIAKTLAFNQVDYFAVAYTDEGVVLRKAGIKTPIMVMNPEKLSFDLIVKYNLEPAIYNLRILKDLINATNGQEIGIHIEVDSGMKRLGFDENQVSDLISLLQQNTPIQIKSIFSHLAASEAHEHDAFTQNQIQKFDKFSSKIQTLFPYKILRHILNSGGITRFKNAQFDMVRLGIGLYGIDPSLEVQKQLQAIGTLKTVISQIRNISEEESIGYGRRGKVSKPSRIAIVAIGYADGLDRQLGNKNGYMLVNGKQAPIIGSICMDMTMIDVTGINCKEGNEVIVFGGELSIETIANKLNTIPYEVLTSISQRVKRVYYAE